MAKIVIFGDIKTKGQAISVDPRIKKICSEADVVIANLEGPVVTSARPREGKRGSPLASDKLLVSLIEALSVTTLTFGNNHIMDYGVEGLNETIDFVKGLNIDWVGASDGNGRGSHILIDERKKLAILSFAHKEGPVAEIGSHAPGPFVLPEFNCLAAEVRRLTARGFAVIVSYHGGEEFFDTPWPRRVAWARELTEAGAILVFGQHSHSVQPVYSTGQGGYIAPGLGNTYFETPYQKAHKGTTAGRFLVLDTVSGTLGSYAIKAEWENKQLLLAGGITSPVKFSDKEIRRGWSADCRRKVFGNRLNVLNTNKRWRRSVFVSLAFVLRVARMRFKDVRDADILAGALPIYGAIYAKKLLKTTGKHFKY